MVEIFKNQYGANWKLWLAFIIAGNVLWVWALTVEFWTVATVSLLCWFASIIYVLFVMDVEKAMAEAVELMEKGKPTITGSRWFPAYFAYSLVVYAWLGCMVVNHYVPFT